jgi:hypothetical protein
MNKGAEADQEQAKRRVEPYSCLCRYREQSVISALNRSLRFLSNPQWHYYNWQGDALRG